MYNYKSDDDKRVEDINKNQKILTENIKKNISNKLFILDSHTCLLDLNNNIVKISHKWLMKLNVVGVILLYDDLEKIKKRLYERDNLDFDISFLERFQECEKENVVGFAKKNRIPFIEFKNSDSLNILLDFIVTIK